jgi:hypothetical protein
MTSIAPLPRRFHRRFSYLYPNSKKPSKTSRFQRLNLVAGTRSVLNLRDPQVEGGAGGRNHLNLRQQNGRLAVVEDLRDLASQFEIIARASNRLHLLFRAAV